MNYSCPTLRIASAALVLGTALLTPQPSWGESLPSATSRIGILTDAETWKRLPKAIKGGGQPLPLWARALADKLPLTTARLLLLDRQQRAGAALDPVLRARVRLAAARANRSNTGTAYALADLHRAGVSDAASESGGAIPPLHRQAMSFARKLSLSASELSDAEVESLRRQTGDARLVAIVLVVAYANFQDRLFLTLDLPVEASGPLPPLDVQFELPKPPMSTPAANKSATVAKSPTGKQADDPAKSKSKRPAPDKAITSAVKPATAKQSAPASVHDPFPWSDTDFTLIVSAMERQKARPTRIVVPDWYTVLKGLPADYPLPPKPSRIRWSLVCLGYQPNLSAAWLMSMRTFGTEAKQDRIFEETLFAVITREIDCFY